MCPLKFSFSPPLRFGVPLDFSPSGGNVNLVYRKDSANKSKVLLNKTKKLQERVRGPFGKRWNSPFLQG